MEFLEEDFQFEDIFAPEQMIRQLFLLHREDGEHQWSDSDHPRQEAL